MMSITTQDYAIRQEQIEKLELALVHVKNNQSPNDFKEQLRREIYINALESQLEETREAIENIRLSMVNKQPHPWKKFVGMFKDDPMFDEFVEDMAAYRRKLDAEMAAAEEKSEENQAE